MLKRNSGVLKEQSNKEESVRHKEDNKSHFLQSAWLPLC